MKFNQEKLQEMLDNAYDALIKADEVLNDFTMEHDTYELPMERQAIDVKEEYIRLVKAYNIADAYYAGLQKALEAVEGDDE